MLRAVVGLLHLFEWFQTYFLVTIFQFYVFPFFQTKTFYFSRRLEMVLFIGDFLLLKAKFHSSDFVYRSLSSFIWERLCYSQRRWRGAERVFCPMKIFTTLVYINELFMLSSHHHCYYYQPSLENSVDITLTFLTFFCLFLFLNSTRVAIKLK